MAANAHRAPPLISGSLRKERVLHGVSMGFGDRFCVVEAGLLSWHATQEHAQMSSQPPVGTVALDRWTVISSLKHARSGAPVSKHKVVQPSASWRRLSGGFCQRQTSRLSLPQAPGSPS